MTAAAVRSQPFEIARVIEKTFGAFGRNFFNFYLMALALSGVPTLILQTLRYFNGWTGGAAAFSSPGAIPVTFAAGLVAVVTGFLLQGALVWGTVADLNGRRAPWEELLRAGLRVIWPLFLIAMCFVIAVVFGFILLIVPGVIMICAWIVVAPAEVIERRGVFASFSRSSELTRGHRWSIFALLCALWIASLVVSSLIGVFAAMIGYNTFLAGAGVGALTHDPAFLLFSVVSTLISLVLTVLGAVGAGVLYYELRAAKEGIGPEALASIFD